MFAIELLQDALWQAQRPAATLDLPEHPALAAAVLAPLAELRARFERGGNADRLEE